MHIKCIVDVLPDSILGVTRYVIVFLVDEIDDLVLVVDVVLECRFRNIWERSVEFGGYVVFIAHG